MRQALHQAPDRDEGLLPLPLPLSGISLDLKASPKTLLPSWGAHRGMHTTRKWLPQPPALPCLSFLADSNLMGDLKLRWCCREVSLQMGGLCLERRLPLGLGRSSKVNSSSVPLNDVWGFLTISATTAFFQALHCNTMLACLDRTNAGLKRVFFRSFILQGWLELRPRQATGLGCKTKSLPSVCRDAACAQVWRPSEQGCV